MGGEKNPALSILGASKALNPFLIGSGYEVPVASQVRGQGFSPLPFTHKAYIASYPFLKGLPT